MRSTLSLHAASTVCRLIVWRLGRGPRVFSPSSGEPLRRRVYKITDLVSFFFNGSIAGLVFLIVLLFAIFICCLRRKLPSGVPKPSICTTVKVSHYWRSKLTISVTDFLFKIFFAILVSLGENWLTSGEMTFSKFKSFTGLGRSSADSFLARFCSSTCMQPRCSQHEFSPTRKTN